MDTIVTSDRTALSDINTVASTGRSTPTSFPISPDVFRGIDPNARPATRNRPIGTASVPISPRGSRAKILISSQVSFSRPRSMGDPVVLVFVLVLVLVRSSTFTAAARPSLRPRPRPRLRLRLKRVLHLRPLVPYRAAGQLQKHVFQCRQHGAELRHVDSVLRQTPNHVGHQALADAVDGHAVALPRHRSHAGNGSEPRVCGDVRRRENDRSLGAVAFHQARG